MAAKSIKEIQAKLEAEKSRNSIGDNASYPFWNLPDGSTALIRFLPDLNEDNCFFWIEKNNIRLKFPGVLGEHDNEITIPVPCMNMWGEKDPIIEYTRPWWKDSEKEDLARQYWKKKTYIFQGFVVNSPLVEESVPENPIRRFVINPSIYEIIRNSLTNPEMEDNPCDFDGGRDFKLTKTKKGEYANYTTSQWSFKTRKLGEAELAAIEKYGLRDLSEFKGRKPDAEEAECIWNMFEDSLAGNPFDAEKYGKFYKVYGKGASDTPAVTAKAPQASKAADTADEPQEAAGKAPTRAQSILENIRKRNTAPATAEE